MRKMKKKKYNILCQLIYNIYTLILIAVFKCLFYVWIHIFANINTNLHININIGLQVFFLYLGYYIFYIFMQIYFFFIMKLTKIGKYSFLRN